MCLRCRKRESGAVGGLGERALPWVAVAMLLVGAACEREQRRFEEVSPASSVPKTITMSELQPGTPAAPVPPRQSEYEENAWALSEGQRYYQWFNCVGCHAHGGGGMGPPLMDHRWIYGSEPENIYASIVEGRPNGMPSFRGRIPNQQVWQLVAYVRSLSGLVPKDASPSRPDSMFSRKPPLRTPEARPKPEGTAR